MTGSNGEALAGNDRHKSTRQLNQDIRAWIETWNDDPQPRRLGQDRRPDPRIDQTLRHNNQ
jgi:hypothetical protein